MYNTMVKEVKFYEENGKYYANVTYVTEDNSSIKEINYPKVYIPFIDECREIEMDYKTDKEIPSFSRIRNTQYLVINRLIQYPLDAGGDCGRTCVVKVIKEKTQKMTVEDIEKKLGYKIEIVSKK